MVFELFDTVLRRKPTTLRTMPAELTLPHTQPGQNAQQYTPDAPTAL